MNAARSAGVPEHAVAREAGISCAYLSMIAADEREPSPEVEVAIADALGLGVDEIFPR